MQKDNETFFDVVKDDVYPNDSLTKWNIMLRNQGKGSVGVSSKSPGFHKKKTSASGSSVDNKFSIYSSRKIHSSSLNHNELAEAVVQPHQEE